MKAFAPNGEPIMGTYETCPGRADTIEDSFARDAHGQITYEHEGTTEFFYEGQETVKVQNEIVFLDEKGNEWRESQLVLADEPPATPY